MIDKKDIGALFTGRYVSYTKIKDTNIVPPDNHIDPQQ